MADERRHRGAAWGLPAGLPPRALRRHVHGRGRSIGDELGLQVDSPALTSATDERRRALLRSLLASADRAVATAARRRAEHRRDGAGRRTPGGRPTVTGAASS